MRDDAGVEHPHDDRGGARGDVPRGGGADALEVPLAAVVGVVRRRARAHDPVGLGEHDAGLARQAGGGGDGLAPAGVAMHGRDLEHEGAGRGASHEPGADDGEQALDDVLGVGPHHEASRGAVGSVERVGDEVGREVEPAGRDPVRGDPGRRDEGRDGRGRGGELEGVGAGPGGGRDDHVVGDVGLGREGDDLRVGDARARVDRLSVARAEDGEVERPEDDAGRLRVEGERRPSGRRGRGSGRRRRGRWRRTCRRRRPRRRRRRTRRRRGGEAGAARCAMDAFGSRSATIPKSPVSITTRPAIVAVPVGVPLPRRPHPRNPAAPAGRGARRARRRTGRGRGTGVGRPSEPRGDDQDPRPTGKRESTRGRRRPPAVPNRGAVEPEQSPPSGGDCSGPYRHVSPASEGAYAGDAFTCSHCRRMPSARSVLGA